MQTKMLSDFVSALTWEDLTPKEAVVGKMCVEDLIGVALAGSVRPQGAIWRNYFSHYLGPSEATAWASGLPTLQHTQAAALNAAYGHLLDMDDVHNASITHLGVVTIPAALSVGQQLHRSGKEVLCAIAAGYEVGARVGEAITPDSYYYWHTTGVVGGLSAATAAGYLLRLTPEQLCHALGSAGTQAAGLWEFLSDGAMSKSLHTANATLCGLRSAELAALGFTGATHILEGDRGLLRAFSNESDPNTLTRGMDYAHLKILGTSLKPYACCRHIHSAAYAAESIRACEIFKVEDILSIVDRTYDMARQTTDCPCPATTYAYKFSAQYCIAAMLMYGNLLDAMFTEATVQDCNVHALMRKITVVTDDTLEREHCADPNCWPHLLVVTLRGGNVLQFKVDYPLGDFNNPFDWDMTDSKFSSLADGILPVSAIKTLCTRIRKLDELDDINQLFAGLEIIK